MMTLARSRTAQQLAAGAGVQVALLAALSTEVGLGLVGWLTGLACTVGVGVLLAGALRRTGTDALGPAGLVTLVRSVLVGGLTALVADRLLTGGNSAVATLVVVATVALVLDAVDGQVARRSGTASALGARFDMEVDAFLILVLSVHVALLVGPWALAIGLMRYGFVAASWMLPWMRAALPARFSAKTVAALQGIVLVVATAEVLPRSLTVGLVTTALALLAWSFGRDVAWLWRHARRPRRPSRGSRRSPTPSTSADVSGAARLPTGFVRGDTRS
jgi:phosphatidylglycerophosphate synthase